MYRLFCSLLLLAFAVAGQTAPAAKKPTPKTAQHSASDDAALERTIRAKLAASKISTDKFEAHVQGGVVTFTGKTGVLQHKGTATRLAKNAGAKAVVNKIEVSEDAKERAAANLASGQRRAQVKRSEVANRN